MDFNGLKNNICLTSITVAATASLFFSFVSANAVEVPKKQTTTPTSIPANTDKKPAPLPSKPGAKAPAKKGVEAPVYERDYDGKIIVFEKGGLKTTQIKWPSDKIKAIRDVTKKEPVYTTHLRGKLTGEDYKVVWNAASAKTNKQGFFDLELVVSAESTRLQLQIIGPKGDISIQTIELSFPGFGKPKPQRWRFNVGGGYTLITYKQDTFVDNSEGALTVKGGASFQIIPGMWDIGLSGYYNALVLTKSGTTAIRFYGANLRTGYFFQRLPPSLRLGIHTGLYYTGVQSSDEFYGYGAVSGPQLLPTIEYRFSPTFSTGGYVKFSPIGSGISIMGFSNREIAAGTSFNFVVKKKYSLSLSFDFANLGLMVPDADETVTTLHPVSSKTLSFGASLGF